ncbi:MAG: T9SS type A sorting domain-containing protein [Candidatus Kapabacteria bacterium]|nr:T9SS type A sorting domain-containing protein [Candidatus Kapabacteria bacterium]
MKSSKLYLMIMMAALPFIMAQSEPAGYVVLSWNDLGMHCSNKDFSSLVVLPPYNNLLCQVIKKGDENSMPEIITDGLKVTYEIPGNTTSTNKTNFWQYANAIFGVTLADNIGLTGKGLTGEMDIKSGYFTAAGIPLTPYTDADLINEDPYQLALVKAFDINNNYLGSSTPVIPVSNEIGCVSSGCHSSEQAILNSHENEDGFDPTKKPILCAKCHASNALGTTGIGEAPIFSYVIHEKHAGKTSDCYKCHPGQKTKCFRDVMSMAGMQCSDCHGSMSNVATTISQGRRPWLDEPSCGASACHGSNYKENEGLLFRQSKGHGGVYCSGCHGEPHGIVPTREGSRDNAQNIALQGYQGALRECKVCHTVAPTAPGPHNILPSEVKVLNDDSRKFDFNLKPMYPSPLTSTSVIPFSISKAGDVHVDIYSEDGRHILNLLNQYLLPAEYSVNIQSGNLSSGIYICVLKVNGATKTSRLVVQK